MLMLAPWMRTLLLLLVLRMAAAPFAVQGTRAGQPIGKAMVMSRCAWPAPQSRQAAARLAVLVRHAGTAPSAISAPPSVAVAGVVDAAPARPGALDRYAHLALGRPRC